MKRKLIIHVGMEKTGTSSIQLTSQQNIEQLKVNGISYLGLMLDKTPKKIFDWQNPRGWTQCITLDKKRFKHEFRAVFNSSLLSILFVDKYSFNSFSFCFVLSTV